MEESNASPHGKFDTFELVPDAFATPRIVRPAEFYRRDGLGDGVTKGKEYSILN